MRPWDPTSSNGLPFLSGPSHAEEVGRRIPTAVVAASSHLSVPTAAGAGCVHVSPFPGVYQSEDVTGVEMGGSLKNIIASGHRHQ
jgi:glycerol-3-phosphate dehydrogenase (NAD(P)+)